MMNPRRKRILPPPGSGTYVWGGVTEAVSEEEKAGRPVAPRVELLPIGPPLVITEAVSEEEKAGRPVAPPLWPDEPDRQAAVVTLHAAVAGLTEQERVVFEKVFLHGYGYARLAAVLGSTPAAVRDLAREAADHFRSLVGRQPTTCDEPSNGTAS